MFVWIFAAVPLNPAQQSFKRNEFFSHVSVIGVDGTFFMHGSMASPPKSKINLFGFPLLEFVSYEV